ncbi:GspE/PulE family protein [Desulforudis sp. 1088]|uniref:GspE/PulE family protein n=2 Tax=Candidatus Desulforudis TaxID=471826 RepID=UPI003CE4804F
MGGKIQSVLTRLSPAWTKSRPGGSNDSRQSPDRREKETATPSGLKHGERHFNEAVTSEDMAPVVRLTNSLITGAINARASDIHFEPHAGEIAVRFRIDGVLREIRSLPLNMCPAIVSRLKIMAGINIAEKRVPQDGRIQFPVGDRSVDLRVSTMPTVFGEKVAIRVLDRTALPPGLDQLGFTAGNLERLRSIMARPHGIILVTGPTGSGKTTSLYAMLSELASPQKNVVTIEDPVEYILPGTNQTQINPAAGLTFATGLRSILRQDPDVIMVGEIRDAETAAIATRAATTGHLVLSTLHTNDAAGALTRLIDLGVEPFLVASAVLGVVAQRLVRTVCAGCRDDCRIEPGTLEHAFLGCPEKPVTVKAGRGCLVCGHTGFYGRTSIQEVLTVTPLIMDLITRKVPSSVIFQEAMREGLLPLRECGIEKVLAGVTTVQEVMRVAWAGENPVMQKEHGSF